MSVRVYLNLEILPIEIIVHWLYMDPVIFAILANDF